MTKEERREYNRQWYEQHRKEILIKRKKTRYTVPRQVNSHGYYRAENIKRAYDERRQQDTTARR